MTNPSLWCPFIFTLDPGWTASTTEGGNTASNTTKAGQSSQIAGEHINFDRRGLAEMVGGGLGGLLSCNTNLSDVTYSFRNNSMNILRSNLMNGTSAVGFTSAMAGAYSNAQLYQGLLQATAAAQTPEDLANAFANSYDQAMVALPAGILLERPAESASKRVQTLVTRIPKAPFLCLVILDMLYAVIGIGLTVPALITLSVGRGVRDAQVRLSIAAIVAECFESPVLGDDKTEVDHLFAERKGLATGRVALGRRITGGRRYRQVIR